MARAGNTTPAVTGYWLMKCEPAAYTIDDLARDGYTEWEGVRNYQARNFIRQMRPGDRAIFYASNARPSGAVGLMRICSEPYADPTQFDPASNYYDPKATEAQPRWVQVDVCYEATFPRALPLADIKNDPQFDGMLLARKGDRLSIQPVEQRHFDALIQTAYV